MKNDAAQNPFYSVKSTPESIMRMNTLRKSLDQTFQGIDLLVTEDKSINFGPREYALFKTNYEQAAMWLTKAIAHYNPIKEEQEGN